MRNQSIKKKYIFPGFLVMAFAFSVTVFISGSVYAAESETALKNLEKLIKTKNCRGCNLSGLTLNRLDLVGADLEGADLSSAKLSLTNLSRANLRKCNLRGAIFGGTDLSDADLRGADLRGTSLDSSYYQGAQFDGEFVVSKPYENIGESDVEKKVFVADPAKPKQSPETGEAKVGGGQNIGNSPSTIAAGKAETTPSQANLQEGKRDLQIPGNATLAPPPAAKKIVPMQQAVVETPLLDEKNVVASSSSTVSAKKEKQINSQSTVAKAPSTPKIIEEKLKKETNVEVSKQKTDVDTKKTENLKRLLEKNKCYGCDLSGLDLSGKNLDSADLEKADLTGCNLEKADLEKANLKGALLVKANLRKARLKNADFYRADLSGANMTEARVEGTMLDGAQTETTVGLKQATGNIKK